MRDLLDELGVTYLIVRPLFTLGPPGRPGAGKGASLPSPPTETEGTAPFLRRTRIPCCATAAFGRSSACSPRSALVAPAWATTASLRPRRPLVAAGGSASAVPACLDIPALYALTGPESTGFANWSDAADLATTVGSAYAADLPDEPLTITGPGEESGTYDTYVESMIAGIAEEQGLPEEEAVVRPDYTSSPNDNVIIEGIAGAGQLLRLGRLRLRRGEPATRSGRSRSPARTGLCRARPSTPSPTAPTRCPGPCSST